MPGWLGIMVVQVMQVMQVCLSSSLFNSLKLLLSLSVFQNSINNQQINGKTFSRIQDA